MLESEMKAVKKKIVRSDLRICELESKFDQRFQLE